MIPETSFSPAASVKRPGRVVMSPGLTPRGPVDPSVGGPSALGPACREVMTSGGGGGGLPSGVAINSDHWPTDVRRQKGTARSQGWRPEAPALPLVPVAWKDRKPFEDRAWRLPFLWDINIPASVPGPGEGAPGVQSWVGTNPGHPPAQSRCGAFSGRPAPLIGLCAAWLSFPPPQLFVDVGWAEGGSVLPPQGPRQDRAVTRSVPRVFCICMRSSWAQSSGFQEGETND